MPTMPPVAFFELVAMFVVPELVIDTLPPATTSGDGRERVLQRASAAQTGCVECERRACRVADGDVRARDGLHVVRPPVDERAAATDVDRQIGRANQAVDVE